MVRKYIYLTIKTDENNFRFYIFCVKSDHKISSLINEQRGALKSRKWVVLLKMS